MTTRTDWRTFSARQRLALAALREAGPKGHTAVELSLRIVSTVDSAARIATSLVCAGYARRQTLLGRTIYVADVDEAPA